MTTKTTTKALELTADAHVARLYNDGRALGYLDLGGSRREAALWRLEDRAGAARIAANVSEDELAAELADGATFEAFRRLIRRRIARRDGADASVRNALRRAAQFLEEDGIGASIALTEVGITTELELIDRRGSQGKVVA